MLEKLQTIEKRYLDLREQSVAPDVMSDMTKFIAINKELSGLQKIYDLIQDYKKYTNQLNESKEILNTEKDPDMLEMAEEELKDAENKIPELEQQIKIALLPTDPNDDKNIYLEIRPAA
jgi:peptide chain release factor 1